VEHGGKILSLVASPFVEKGELFLPLQIFSEHLVALAPDRFSYTAVTRELTYTPPASAKSPVVAAAPPRKSASPPSNSASSAKPEKRLVVVDAGHGGPDNGMTGPIGARHKIPEKTITLQVAKRLRTALIARGVDVVMTRTTDTLIALSDRGRIANREHGDLFISVHVNGPNMRWKNPQAVRGFETFFLAEAKTEDDRRVANMENESVRFETDAEAEKDDPLGFIIADMAQNEHLRESAELAKLIQERLAEFHPGPDRGVKQAGFRVLVTAFMPSVLVEIGFGSNPAESRFITTPASQQRIANAIADAAVQYLARYERRLGGGVSP
jgi:N-acetylmuramoyl-L-alanine amidase